MRHVGQLPLAEGRSQVGGMPLAMEEGCCVWEWCSRVEGRPPGKLVRGGCGMRVS